MDFLQHFDLGNASTLAGVIGFIWWRLNSMNKENRERDSQALSRHQRLNEKVERLDAYVRNGMTEKFVTRRECQLMTHEKKE